jgi:2-keto-4-pentenoate hydratase/2-oxohepta-3-ene-1,7-dioic acid hydratase in catechol pathway
MKLCAYEKDGQSSFGIYVEEKGIIDLKLLLEKDGIRCVDDLIVSKENNSGVIDHLSDALNSHSNYISVSDITWRPPVQRPGKIVGVAINNRIGQAFAHRPFEKPAFFLKPRTSLVGHGVPVVIRDDYGLTHPEPELAVIIGKGGKHIREENALDHVFGYSIINDITSPSLKEKDSLEIVIPDVPDMKKTGYGEMQNWRNVRDAEHARSIYLTYHALSKGSDGFGPMGPWIVTKDEIADPNNLWINSFAGSTPAFEDSTANLTFSVEEVIAHLSSYFTLESGDVVHMGTSMQPADEGGQFRMITDWDLTAVSEPISIEIEGIGRLENPIVKEFRK